MAEQIVETGRQPPPVAGQQDYPYDVFISFNQADREYVEGELYPRLKGGGVSIIYDEDFQIGKPWLVNIEEAVEQSRHTLVVLTPAWVADQWQAFEVLLGASGDPAGQQRRILPLLLRPCTPPKLIKHLTYADFTDPQGREREMARLLRSIRMDAPHDGLPAQKGQPTPAPQPAQSVRKGIEALAELVRKDQKVRDEVVKFEIDFQAVRERIEVLGDHKDLHDLLHEMQVHFYNVIIWEVERFPEERTRRLLLQYEFRFGALVERLQEVSCRPSFTKAQVVWLQYLAQARQELIEAIAGRDRGKLTESIKLVRGVLAKQPSKINTRLNALAGDLRLASLTQALGALRDKLATLQVDPEKLRQFQGGADSLDALDGRLGALVAEHDAWQEIDDRLRRIEAVLEEDVDELASSWPELKGMLGPLVAQKGDGRRDAEFRAAIERLHAAVKAGDPINMRMDFEAFRGHTTECFYKVDKSLRDLCGELRAVGAPLVSILEVIR